MNVALTNYGLRCAAELLQDGLQGIDRDPEHTLHCLTKTAASATFIPVQQVGFPPDHRIQ